MLGRQIYDKSVEWDPMMDKMVTKVRGENIYLGSFGIGPEVVQFDIRMKIGMSVSEISTLNLDVFDWNDGNKMITMANWSGIKTAKKDLAKKGSRWRWEKFRGEHRGWVRFELSKVDVEREGRLRLGFIWMAHYDIMFDFVELELLSG